ncbi:MAG: 3'(2'),5'-bisphosphate nucleotidase CysQ, partial [Novosphingobium sp.]|nr:3'(2'),5'-bisphosphate nucleotidase CysQ [Novosphingobium sp.]
MIDRARLEGIIRRAGEIALAGWPGNGHALEVWEKKPGDPVSEADLAVDAFLRSELSALLPAAGWLSEETADVDCRTHGSLVWLVDPIDGTRGYILS